MKNISGRLLVVSIFLFTLTSTSLAQSILGKWRTVSDETGKSESIIKIYKAKNGKVYGEALEILDKSKGSDPLCTKCEDERKNKPIKGMLLINGLTQSGRYWQGGKILDPEKGKEYSCKIWLENGELKVRGYWGMFYRTQTWYKIE